MTSYPEILHYLGRYHILLLHLPIGFIAMAFLMEITARFRKTESYDSAIVFILFWSAVLSVLTSISGYLLSFEGGYEINLLDQHFWLGIATTALTFVVYGLKKAKNNSRISFVGFLGLAALLGFTGHIGGSLTHGVDHLSTYRPVFTKFNRSKKDTPLITGSTEIFSGIIQPIFEDKCVQCHNTQKIKGGLLMTTADGIKKGGDSGHFLKARDISQSLFLQRAKLPLDNKEHMPPRGKNQLTEDELSLLEWWIEEGATFSQPLDSIKQPNAVKTIIEKMNLRPKGVFALDIPAANPSKIKALNDKGVRIWSLAKDSPLLQVDLSNDENISSKTIASLGNFSKQIIDLDLGHSSVDDHALKKVSNLEHLSRLYLQGTKITNAGLKQLSDLKYLEYLNLYQTDVSDEGLVHLEKLKNLEVLYLWQTKVTTEGIQKLKAAIPNLKITMQSGDDVFADVKLNAPNIEIIGKRNLFKDTLIFKLKSSFKGATVFYTLDGSEPNEESLQFKDSVILTQSADLQALAIKDGWIKSDPLKKELVKINKLAKKITLSKEPSPDYPGKGPQTLSDLARGSNFVKSPSWMGWQGSNVTTVLDYGEVFEMKEIKVGFMENTNAWVFAPRGLQVWTSKDGKNYEQVVSEKYEPRDGPSGVELRFLSHAFDAHEARFVKVKIEGNKKNPDWHLAPGEPSWFFMDEIVVN